MLLKNEDIRIQPLRKIYYLLSVSLDGFIEDPNGDLSWSEPSDELYRHIVEQEMKVDVHFYGRGLYENMAAAWSNTEKNASASQRDIEYSRWWKGMQKVVFSTTLDKVEWNSRLVKGNIAAEVNRLKAQPGGLMSVGGAGLAASFMKLDLIDEYRLYVRPVILGGGKPMFPVMETRRNLHLVETRTFDNGAVLLVYQNRR